MRSGWAIAVSVFSVFCATAALVVLFIAAEPGPPPCEALAPPFSASCIERGAEAKTFLNETDWPRYAVGRRDGVEQFRTVVPSLGGVRTCVPRGLAWSLEEVR